ncbi:hypothetical protein Dalk_4575 [Desulfatibacillum aliphaticivorans]|uniref:Uncharacterized protein n=1 Tax=Desulfatibacillum aliphaticivorans TaxID=218208 RepID=B8FNH2_DESAL|nr:hypothetical protein [Desulfatibacillum aliphaticivorans]ACL06253.1 hypothetical protein Dalk_4575 [Desulfatibacillum aliphaticivorans]
MKIQPPEALLKMCCGETYENMWAVSLDRAQHLRTCNYWYLVDNYATPHTAFRTKEHMEAWLNLLGLALEEPLPQKTGEHGSAKVVGRYKRLSVVCSQEEWDSFRPEKEVRMVSNGRYTAAKMFTEKDGTAVMVVPNPNCKWRKEYDHAETRALNDKGILAA